MSSILKLQILGVRAFDNHEAQELEFGSPLTLICGPNGVGKTTVIECLRYISTGDLPPNAKGGAFVHDPRMSSEKEVKAQVKLSFLDKAGTQLVAARNMRLSVSNKGTPNFKTLDGFIRVRGQDNANTSSASSKSGDLNVQIPLALGIPPAIINYVVFCHQEESLWPLAEPSIIKKRFDEIFEATKYTKALESFKVIRKDYLSNIKVETVQVQHLKEDQQRVLEKQSLLADLKVRVEELQLACDQSQEQRVSKSNELDLAVEHSQRAQQLAYTTKDIGRQRDQATQNIELLKSDIRELLESVSTKEISNLLEESNEGESKLDQEHEALRSQRTEFTTQLEQRQQSLAILANQQGRIEQLQEAHNARVAKRGALTDGREPNDWKKTLDSELQSLNDEMDDLELKHRQAQDVISKQVSSIEAEQLQQRQISSNARSAIQRYETRASDLKKEINQLRQATNSGESADLIEKRLQDLTKELSEAQANQQKFETDGILPNAADQVSSAEKKADSARSQLQEAIEASSAQSRLQYLQDSKNETQGLLASATTEVESKLKHVGKLPEMPGDDTEQAAERATKLEEHVLQLQKQLSLSENELAKELSRADAEHRSSQKALSDSKTKLGKQEAALTQHMTELPPDVTIENFDEMLETAEADLLSATEEQEQLSFAFSYFGAALKAAQRPDEPICMLCEHHKTPSEANNLISKLEERLKALNISPEDAKSECDAKRASLQGLKQLKPLVDKLKRIRQEVDVSRAEITSCEKSLEAANKHKETAKHSYEDKHKESEELNKSVDSGLKKLIQLREQYTSVCQKVKMEASIFSSSQPEKSPQAAQQELEQADFELKQHRANLDRVRSESERLKSRCSTISHAVQELTIRRSNYELESEKLRQAEQQLTETLQLQSESRSELDVAQNAIPEIERRIDDMTKALRDKKHEHAQEERKVAEARTVTVSKLKSYEDLTSQIDEFMRTHGDNPLAQLQKEADSIKNSVHEFGLKISELDKQVSEVEKQRVDFVSYRRNLNDNLRLRALSAELEEIKAKFQEANAELEKAQNEIGADYEARIRSLQQVVGELNHDIAAKTGEAKALQEQSRQIETELSTIYKDTEEHYLHAEAQLEASQRAVDDLKEYVKALDGAIMQYHSMKMSEINEILDEMWKKTYTGTDIDTILIRSESDAGSASTRANYNYRVCMVKQDTELDMRGRCSAGQKVLASILIRMALAECFGSSSGLIVLDEPTTNLDRENIEALAQSLSDIIASRRGQENFQLIVITHDEHFLAQMNPADYCSSYYRITRDPRQLSKVHKMPIASLSL